MSRCARLETDVTSVTMRSRPGSFVLAPTIRRSITIPPFIDPGEQGEGSIGFANRVGRKQAIGDQRLNPPPAFAAGRETSPTESHRPARPASQDAPRASGTGLRGSRALALTLGLRDIADDAVFQQLLEKGRRGIPACKFMALDEIENVLGQKPGAGATRSGTKILRKRRVSHEPTLLGREQRRDPLARFVDQQQRSGLPANALVKRGTNQDVIRCHRHKRVSRLRAKGPALAASRRGTVANCDRKVV